MYVKLEKYLSKNYYKVLEIIEDSPQYSIFRAVDNNLETLLIKAVYLGTDEDVNYKIRQEYESIVI